MMFGNNNTILYRYTQHSAIRKKGIGLKNYEDGPWHEYDYGVGIFDISQWPSMCI